MFTGKEGETCGNCMFFAPQANPNDLKKSGTEGECRRFPPMATPILANTASGPQFMGAIAPWSVTKAVLWCGEGQLKTHLQGIMDTQKDPTS